MRSGSKFKNTPSRSIAITNSTDPHCLMSINGRPVRGTKAILKILRLKMSYFFLCHNTTTEGAGLFFNLFNGRRGQRVRVWLIEVGEKIATKTVKNRQHHFFVNIVNKIYTPYCNFVIVIENDSIAAHKGDELYAPPDFKIKTETEF